MKEHYIICGSFIGASNCTIWQRWNRKTTKPPETVLTFVEEDEKEAKFRSKHIKLNTEESSQHTNIVENGTTVDYIYTKLQDCIDYQNCFIILLDVLDPLCKL